MTGAGAAALTAAAVFMAPAAAAAPADEVEDAVQAVQEQAEQAVDEAEQALEEARQQAEEAAEEGGERAEDEAREAVQEAEDALDEAQREAEQAMDQAQDVFGSMPQADMGTWLPDDLRQDLRNLQELPASERAQELQQIVQSGLSGTYGNEVEGWTERIGGVISSLPQNLRQDIQSVFGQEPEEARADVRQIVEGAVDGEYGRDVEKWADWMRSTAQRWDLSRAIQGAPMETSGDVPSDIMDRLPADVREQIPNEILERIEEQLQGN